MITKEELCEIIEEVFPKAGACGVDFDKENKGLFFIVQFSEVKPLVMLFSVPNDLIF
jgi:hypothetical protein